MAAFAALSGDQNPLHLDEAFAQRAGFPGAWCSASSPRRSIRSSVGMHLPGRFALLHGVDVDFKSPAFVGDKLTVAGDDRAPHRRVQAARDQGVGS